MSYEVQRCGKNIIWRMESITPTYTLAGLKSRFSYIGDTRLDPAESIALSRAFIVTWEGHSGYAEPICGAVRFANHEFLISVYYNAETYTPDAIMNAITQDQRDIAASLDNQANNVGYDAANSSTDIGLKHRYVYSMSRLDDDTVNVLQINLRCTIREG